MPTVITGNPANVTTPLTATVAAMANNGSGAVRVTTSAPHLFGPNDTVSMLTSVVRGRFKVTIVDASHFDLIGSTFTATGTGTCSDLSLTPQIQEPTDGDPQSMQLSGLLSSQQAKSDRTQFLQLELVAANDAINQAFKARNWSQQVAFPVGDVGPYAVAWNNSELGVCGQRWVFGGFSPSVSAPTWELYTALGSSGDVAIDVMNVNRVVMNAGASGPTSISCNDSSAGSATLGNIAVTVINHPSAGSFNLWRSGAGGSITTFGAGISGAVTGLSDAKCKWIAGNLVLALGSTTALTGSLCSVTGSVITAMTGAGAVTAPSWILRTNGVLLLAIPAAAGPPNVYATSNGTTCSVTALAPLGSTDVPVDVAWSSSQGLWMLMVARAGGSTRDFYTSPDAATWTRAGSLTSLANGASIVAAGAYWMVANYTAGTFTSNIIISPDGVTWYPTQTTLTALNASVAVLESSPTQVALVAQQTVTTGGVQGASRISQEYGIPTAVIS